MLPQWLEPIRERLERVLPKIELPHMIIKINQNKENKQEQQEND